MNKTELVAAIAEKAELSKKDAEKALAALRKASMKLPVRCKIVKRENGGEN